MITTLSLAFAETATDGSELTWPILLLGLGLALALAEALLPSGGMLSIGSAVALGAALVVAFSEGTRPGMTILVAMALLLPLTIGFGLWLFPRTPFGRSAVNPGLSFDARAATDERDIALVGHRGVASSTLRPAGHATIDGRRVDVVSRGDSIEAGTPVLVVEVSGNRVVVARDESPGARA
jgi:membrane-bound ClpP family serine protease